ncbi:MAG: class II fructose-bisphosphatase [Desulfuromonadaceae bacterium]|nr:class II fructose-bisphosphatase [Desulfuromonadaceae bacterium]
MPDRVFRNLGMELVRVTEAAALSAARFMGTGDKEAGDGAAVDAMRAVLQHIEMDGLVVIGEGEKDEAPMLFNGERVGNGCPPQMDVAVDPVEGTRLLAFGRPNAIAVIAVAPRGSFWAPGPSLYMDKIVVEKEAAEVIDITLSATENLHRIADALGRPVSDLTVFVLDKPRHEGLINDIRKAGARISLQSDGDVLGAVMAAIPGTGIDVLMGIGGTPEGVIAAAAVKAIGGGMQGRRAPQKDYERQALAVLEGEDAGRVLSLDDLVRSEDAFFAATGITGGSFLEGVHFDRQGGVTTHSIVIRAVTGSIRHVKGIHQLRPEHVFGRIDTQGAVQIAVR